MRQRLVAGVLAAVLVAGAGALAVIAANNTGDGGGGPRALPVLGASGTRTEAAADEAAASMIAPRGEIVYEFGELAEIDGEAAAWRVGRDEGDVRERMRDLAAALGLSGDVETLDHGWAIVDGNRRLEVQNQPGLPWYFSSEALDAVVSSDSVAVECAPDGRCAAVPEEYAEPERPADLPSQDEAETIAREVLGVTGVADGDVRVDDLTTVWSVTIEPFIGGLPSLGFGSSVSIGGGGAVHWASGWLGVPSEADVYPLIGTAAAVERLEEQGGGHIGVLGGPEPAIGETEPLTAESPLVDCPPTADCVDHEPVDDVVTEPLPEPEPIVVKVTGVRLGLLFVPAFESDDAWFVPAYFFEIDDGQGGESPVFGVPDEFLAEPVVSEPEPAPEPGGSGGGSAGSTGTAEAQCAGSAGSAMGTGAEPANQPPSVEVCRHGEAVAGEPVVFTLTAKDPDSGIRDDCGSPVAAFGDEEDGVAVCDIGCVSSDTGPGELQREFEHVYAEPGTYTATFTLYGCEDDGYAEQISVSLDVTVR